MSLAQTQAYMTSKATLLSQINSRDTTGNIQTTLNTISTQKSTVSSNWVASGVLFTSILVSNEDKLQWNRQVNYCISPYGDDEVASYLMTGYNLCNSDINSESNPTNVTTLYTRRDTIKTMINSIVPASLLGILRFGIQA